MEYDPFEKKKKIRWSEQEARLLIRKYCAYQERSHQEVRSCLLDHGIYGDALEDIIAEVITEGFLDEERFACTFARGKFRMKQWGRLKIKSELLRKGVSDYSLRMALKEIEEQEYLQTLTDILQKKEITTSFDTLWDRRKKLMDFALSKGFESDIIQKVLDDMRDNDGR